MKKQFPSNSDREPLRIFREKVRNNFSRVAFNKAKLGRFKDLKIRQWLGVALMLFFSTNLAIGQEDSRSWTLGSGAKFKATITKLDPDGIELQAPGGQRRTFMLDEFELLDRTYLEARLEIQARSNSDGPISWPKRIELAEPPAVFSDGKNYRTEHFSFASDRPVAPELAKELALIFESTLEAVKAMPLNLRPTPPDGMERFEARFTDRKSFNAKVSPKHRTISGEVVKGIYFAQQKHILLPFDSIEISSRQPANGANRVKPNTLIHEITHQVMQNWLIVTPNWLAEGIAEYVALIPYENGRFEFSQAEAGFKKVIRNRYKNKSGPIEIIHPADMLAVHNRTRWNETTNDYLTAMMLTYFFIHLDSANTGEAMAAFFGEAGRARDETATFIADYNAAIADYEVKRLAHNEQVRAYSEAVNRKNAGQKAGSGSSIQLRTSADGRVTVGGQSNGLVPPETLVTPPIIAQYPKSSTLDIAKIAYASALPKLLRGRDFDQLASEAEAAYKRIGLEVKFRPAKLQAAK